MILTYEVNSITGGIYLKSLREVEHEYFIVLTRKELSPVWIGNDHGIILCFRYA